MYDTMTTAVKMPRLGESIVEGTVTRWLKAPGDQVGKLEPLLEISTDKIDTEVPSPAEGVLLEIVAPEGKTLAVGSILAYIGQPSAQTRTPVASNALAAASNMAPTLLTPATATHMRPQEKPSGRFFISPVVARMAAEHKVDLTQIAGTGMGGRVTKKDLAAFVERRREKETGRQGDKESERLESERLESERLETTRPETTRPETTRPETTRPETTRPETTPPETTPPETTSDEVLQPLTAMRRAIAAHMAQSKQTSPHVTTVFEVDMAAVVQHRERHKTSFGDRGLKLTFTPYFVAAVARALRRVGEVNSRFTADGILLNRRIHIGVAVALEQGLIVPVIRDADEKNLQGLTRAVNELAERAHSRKLTPEEIQGGTFTITNHGVGGSLIGTPIINQPQTGILGIGAIVKRPVVRSASSSLLPSADDAIVIRPICYLSFSFDHRVIDGAKADQFLTIVKDQLENWK